MKTRLRRAWARDNQLALDGLQPLAGELERSHPGAAEFAERGPGGDADPHPPGDPRTAEDDAQLTNPIESMIDTIRRTCRNVKRWQNGDMCLRWTAAGMLEAETQFRKIIGYSDLAKLALAVERDLATRRTPIHTTTQEAPIPVTV